MTFNPKGVSNMGKINAIKSGFTRRNGIVFQYGIIEGAWNVADEKDPIDWWEEAYTGVRTGS